MMDELTSEQQAVLEDLAEQWESVGVEELPPRGVGAVLMQCYEEHHDPDGEPALHAEPRLRLRVLPNGLTTDPGPWAGRNELEPWVTAQVVQDVLDRQRTTHARLRASAAGTPLERSQEIMRAEGIDPQQLQTWLLRYTAENVRLFAMVKPAEGLMLMGMRMFELGLQAGREGL